MESSPNGSTPTLPLARKRQLRSRLLWGAFAITTLATAFAVHRLYETVRRELQEQADVALRQQQAKLSERARAASEEVRHETIKALAAFHVEGLGYALGRWDERNPSIIGTFQWDEVQGFLAGSVFPSGVRPDDLVALWREFRASRIGYGGVPTADAVIGSYVTSAVRTVDNPLFPAAQLGYQSENIDLLKDASRPVDPWAGWAGNQRGAATPWVLWYQVGPGAPVRGCFVEAGAIVAKLRAEFSDTRLARVELVARDPSIAVADAASSPEDASLNYALPGFAITGRHGDVFLEKQGDARLAALTIAPLLGIFLLGAIFLARYSQRELRDAERKTTFVTQVSHELRTPLTSIRMFADMLAAPDLPETKRTRFAGTISRESERLGTLIERLLRFNALATGGPAAVITLVDVGSVVTETLEEMEATFSAAGMRIEPSVTAQPILASTDRSALKQALLNLLENALKYARDGQVVRVALVGDADRIRVRVADEGPGIPRDLGARVFEPFVQGGRTLIDKSPGVGLGLSIARGLLRQAGSDLVLLPSEKGAVFEIRLPAAYAP